MRKLPTIFTLVTPDLLFIWQFSRTQGFSSCQENATGVAEIPVHVAGVLGEEAREKVRTYGPPKKSSPAGMKSWESGLTFSCLDCTMRLRKGLRICGES